MKVEIDGGRYMICYISKKDSEGCSLCTSWDVALIRAKKG